MATNDKIRVLIVDDIAETRENIRKLLQFEHDVEVIGGARSGQEGIQASRELKPDVVLMDINMPDMDGITATESIRRNNPTTQIVILSVQGDTNYMRRAMHAGASDFLTKPPAVDELTNAIRRAGKLSQQERQKTVPVAGYAGAGKQTSTITPGLLGKVIVVYSPKGGTGCTTLAVNLAVALNNDETRAVLIDGNLQFGDVGVFLNVHSKNSIVDLAPRSDELDSEFIEEVLTTHSGSGLRALIAPARPEEAEGVTGDQFSKVLEQLRQMYSYIIVDASSTLTDEILAAMDISDLIILITTQDIPSIKNARLFLDVADVLKINRQRILFVMNRFDKRIGITPEKVSQSFKHDIVAVIPADEKIVIPSINRGTPFIMSNHSQPVARGVLSLAEVVRKRLVDISTDEKKKESTSASTKKNGKK